MQIRLVLLLLACAFAAAAASSGRVFSLHTRWHELEAKGYNFEHYKHEFGKVYAHANEELTRRHIFEQNLKKIITHNRSPSTWKAGVNHLTDRTESELAALRGHRRHLAVHPEVTATRASLSSPVPKHVSDLAARPKDIPSSVDWRLKGAVTPVKDQGQCGSCWTFASSETIESAWFLRTGQLFELSEQQIASCTSNPQDCGGTGGCEGGTAEVAFQGVITAGGISSEWMYPYTSWNGTDYTCRMNGGDPYFRFAPFANLSSYVKLPINDQNTLLAAVSTIGPIAISVDASAWSSYESGVFSGCNNANPTIDHAVQLVGYGTDANNGPYWLVRNSWTATWGEMGYIRIARPDTVTCGVDTAPGDGTACKPYPATQTVCGMCGILSDSAYPVVGV